jgi:hypothetical protein
MKKRFALLLAVVSFALTFAWLAPAANAGPDGVCAAIPDANTRNSCYTILDRDLGRIINCLVPPKYPNC